MTAKACLVSILVAVALLGLSACGGDGGGTTTTAGPPPPTTASPPPPPPQPPPAPKPKVTTVRVVFREGQVVGGLVHATVDKGEKVAFVVRSDVSDEVHVHGYDESVEVAPGTPARLVVVASIPGRFEVELEERGLPIADLEVRP